MSVLGRVAVIIQGFVALTLLLTLLTLYAGLMWVWLSYCWTVVT